MLMSFDVLCVGLSMMSKGIAVLKEQDLKFTLKPSDHCPQWEKGGFSTPSLAQ